MSADPPRKAYKYTCSMMRPQIYSEKSLMESVVDFFSDVVPQAYTGTQKNEDREKIQWVRFENCDCNDVAKNPDMFRSDTKGLPLLLILGYSNGVQIWHVTPNGEAQEVLSMRQGPVRICRILPNPDQVLGNSDSFAYKRPLIVMCDSSSAGQPYCGVKFVSLKTGDEVHSISYKTLPVQNIECNKRFLVNIFLEKVCVYETCQFKQLFWITSCFPCSGPAVNPIALSSRWLAYADKRLVAMHQSCGGMSGDGSQSYAATVISAAKGAFKGLSMFGEAMVSSVTGCKPSPVKRDCVTLDNGNRPGIVTVVDIQNIHNEHFNVNEDNEGDGLIAHFHAHANEPVSNMAFDPTGTLLVTACKLGHNFHVFRLMAHPVSSSLGAVHHLYTLHRGETTAKVIDISFNHDSRWITVSSHRGTTHLFPITPYGGPVNIRTHCKPHVVNRASRFHRSAGLDEFDHSVGRRSPVLSTSPSSSGQYDRYPTLIQQNTLNNNMGNPRLPPYPHPITIYPTFQVKQPLNVALNPGNKNQSPSHSPTGFDNVYCVCAKFCTPRLCVIGSPKLDVERRDGGKRPVDSLFVMAQSGTLVEYVLEPRAKTLSDKVTDDCLLELNVVGRMQWNLQRLKNSPELRPPLPSNSPLILSHEAVVSQVPTAPDLYDLPGLTRQDSKDSLSSEHSSKDDSDEQWLSQVEIITHAGPHRRLWMGPQFSFKTYQENTTVLSSNSSSLLSQSPESNMAAMDMLGDEGDLESLKLQPARSNPVSMPNARPAYRRLSRSDSPSTLQGVGAQSVPLLIEAGSFDQSPHLLDVYSNWTESTVAKQPRGSDDMEEDRLKETLADAMVESPCKDMEKLSLRHQDIPRASVRAEKSRGQSGKKNAVDKSEGARLNSKGKTEGVRKTEVEMVKDIDGEKKEQLSETPKGKKGKGKTEKESKAEKKVTPIKIEVSKNEEVVKTDPDDGAIVKDSGKNGKKKINSRRSIEAELSCSDTSVQKSDKNSSLTDNKVDIKIMKTDHDKKANQVKPKETTAKSDKSMPKESTAKCNFSTVPNEKDKKSDRGKHKEITAKSDASKVRNIESSERPGSCEKDTSEANLTENMKSVAKFSSENDVKKNVSTAKNDNTAIDESVENVAHVDTVKRKDDEQNQEDGGFKSEKDKQTYQKSGKAQVNIDTKLNEEIINTATKSKVKEQRSDDSVMTASFIEGQSKGKSKRKNKKQNKNVMIESVVEKSPTKETNQICKELSAVSFKGNEVEGNKENVSDDKSELFEILPVNKETIADPVIEIIDKQELSCVSDIIEVEINDEITIGIDEDKEVHTASSIKKINSPKKNLDEKLKSLKSNDTKLPTDVKEMENTTCNSPEASGEVPTSNVSMVVEPKSKKKGRNGQMSEKDVDLTVKELKTDDDTKTNNNYSLESETNLTYCKSDYQEERKVEIERKPTHETEEKLPDITTEDDMKKLEEEKLDQLETSLKAKDSSKLISVKSEDDTFEVKSKKKRKKKKNVMEDSLYCDVPKDSEKLVQTDLNVESVYEHKELYKENSNIKEVGSSSNLMSKFVADKQIPEDASEIDKTDEFTTNDENSAHPHNKMNIPEVKNDKFNNTDVKISNEDNVTQIKAEKKVNVTIEKNEDAQAELADEDMFVITKKKNRRKKKNEELLSESCLSSSEIKETKSKSSQSSHENAWSKGNLPDACQDTKHLIDSQERIKISHDKIEEGYKEVEDSSLNKKLSNASSVEIIENQMKNADEFVDDEDLCVITSEKKMEDSTGSGSKYETAESAEDDPSAWERFEECSEENESERDTAVESSSNISCEKSDEIHLEDGSSLQGKSKSLGSFNKSERANRKENSKEDKKFDESGMNGNKVTSSLSGMTEEKGCMEGVGTSVMAMSMYDDSAGSSSRSSEERDTVVKEKTSTEKESKNKKKKKKNRK